MSNESNTVASLLTELDGVRSDIIDAINNKGGSVASTARFSELPSAIDDIQTIGNTINVSTIPNATIDISNSQNTYTGSSDQSGNASINGVLPGSYTISVDDGETSITNPTSLNIRDTTSISKVYPILSTTINFVDCSIKKPLQSEINSFPIYSNIGRCNVTDDGTITAYYGDPDYTEDGSNGQVMVKIPKFWYKVNHTDVYGKPVSDGGVINIGTWSISTGPTDGFELHPAFIDPYDKELDYFLIGAFEAVAQDISSGEYSSNVAISSSTNYNLASVAGYRPANTFTHQLGIKYSKRRGIGWTQLAFAQYQAILMLFGIENGFNSQRSIGQGYTYASNTSTIQTGTTTGNETYGDTSTGGDGYGDTKSVNWRGIENLWGNINCWLCGMSRSNGYRIKTKYYYDDDDGYMINLPFSAASGVACKFGHSDEYPWILLPISTAGSTYNIEDGVYGGSYSLPDIGGSYSSGTSAGLFSIQSQSPSTSYAYIGSRIMYIPFVINDNTAIDMCCDFSTGILKKPTNEKISNSSIYSNIGRCNVTDDGTITAYYGDPDYTEDGSNGQVMVKIPKFWYKVNGDGTKISYMGYWSISDTPKEGYTLHPAFIGINGEEIDYFLIGAFEAVFQEGENYQSSISNYSVCKLASSRANGDLLPATGLYSSNEYYAPRRGIGWSEMTLPQLQAIQMLFVIENGFDSSVIGYGNLSSTSIYVGQTTGNTTSGTTSNQTSPVNWRGIENLWGNSSTYVSGIYRKSSSSSTLSYTLDYYPDTNSTYTDLPFSLSSGTSTYYINRFGTHDGWMIFPSEIVNYGSLDPNTYKRGLVYAYYSSSDSKYGTSISFGKATTNNASTGIFDIKINSSSSDKGTRLSYVPNNINDPSIFIKGMIFAPSKPSAISNSSIYSNIGRCNVTDDGTITAYYGDPDYTEDGSNGQVMVKIPKFWYRVISINDSAYYAKLSNNYISISDTPKEGYTLHPAFIGINGEEIDYFLIGAFEAVFQNGNSYTSTYNAAYKMASISGNGTLMPATGFTLENGRSTAALRGTGWYQTCFKQIQAVQLLFIIEHGLNSEVIGSGAHSKIYVGQTTGNTTSGTISNKTSPVNWRGIENLWGNINCWIDGIYIYGQYNYNEYWHIADDFSFNTYKQGVQVTANRTSSSNYWYYYLSSLTYDMSNPWVLLPGSLERGGSSNNISQFVTTYYYSSSGNGSKYCYSLGGTSAINSSSSTSDIDGLFTSYCGTTNYTSSYIGSRLMYIPH